MRLKTADLKQVSIHDSFWDKYTHLVTEEVIPYQWKVLNDELEGVEPSHAIRNFRIAAGLEEGDFYGFVFQDSDVAKWLEAAAYSLAWQPDADLESRADSVIALLADAQREDGYLDTYFLIRDPQNTFSNLRDGHELYCAGHLIEAGVAYFKVTGKDALLKVCEKMADNIVRVFHEPDMMRAIPGHEEIELALVRLYDLTGNADYLNMASDFLDRRGQEPHYFFEEKKRPRWKQIFPEHSPDGYHLDYAQTDRPVRLQDKAEGHAVRAVYLYCAMADVADRKNDPEMLAACERLYENISRRQMYITGGIGSSGWLERFTTDYDLPNAMNYSESCASIGLALFCRRMARITGDGKYMDTAETALYNTVLAGIAMDGKSFFYVNPLAVWPEVCMEGTSRSHVKPVRQGWFSCACCPPNIARTLASLGEYCFFEDEEGFWVNLYVSSSSAHKLGGRDFTVDLETRYPFDGNVKMRLKSGGSDGLNDRRRDDNMRSVREGCAIDGLNGRRKDDDMCGSREGIPAAGSEAAGCIRLRIPAFVKTYRIFLNGSPADDLVTVEKGYAHVRTAFHDGDLLELKMDIPARFYWSDPRVRADAGRVALKKGPLVYCLEQADNGENLEQLLADPFSDVEEIWRDDILKGTMTLKAKGWRSVFRQNSDDELYREDAPVYEPAELTFVPYAYWCNRQKGEMIVWVRSSAQPGSRISG